jgi:hypothetical protein
MTEQKSELPEWVRWMFITQMIGLLALIVVGSWVCVTDHRAIRKALAEGRLVITVERNRPNPVKDSVQVRLIRQD